MPALIRSRLPPSLIQKPFHKWQMPRTGCLVQPYAKEKGCQTIGLALNKRGVDDAVAAGVDYVGFGISVSEEHNKRNSNRKKINFDVCGLSFKHFVLFFAVVFASAIWDLCYCDHLFQFGRCLYCNYICRVCSLSYGSRRCLFLAWKYHSYFK